jgi:alanine-glyoxylate transaminase / serine-glyoxylate transaminase / serine-pyruvate transaminase
VITPLATPATVDGAVPPQRTLLGPGPAPVAAAVLAAQTRGPVGADDPWWEARADEVTAMLRAVLRTANAATTALPGSADVGIEAAVSSVLAPGDTAVVGVAGADGERLAAAAERTGAEVVRLEAPWGQAIPVDRITAAVAEHADVRVVALVHTETSTATLQPLAEVGAAIADTATLLLVDSTAGLGGIPLETDAWGCDVVVAGTEHCLGAPAGLALVTWSPDAVAIAQARPARTRARMLEGPHGEGGAASLRRVPPTPAVFALHEGLRRILDEGLEVRWARHAEVGELFQSHIEDRDATVLTAVGHRVPHLTWFAWPTGTDGRALRTRLREGYGIEVGLGLEGDTPAVGAAARDTWRVGLMADGATHATVDRLLDAIDELREG